MATCQALPSPTHTSLCSSQAQAGLPGKADFFLSTLTFHNQDELIALLLTGTLGISSGLFGSLPMIQVGTRVTKGPNQPICPGPIGCRGGGEGGGGEPDDRLLLLRPHPWQPPCLLARLTPGFSQFKPLSSSDGHLVTSNSQVAFPQFRFSE